MKSIVNKIVITSVFMIANTAYGVDPTAFTFVAPASIAVAPAVTNLTTVVDAFKSVGTAFFLNDPVATGLLDQAALDLTLSIQVNQISTDAINIPIYDSSSGLIAWETNFATTVSTENNWTHIDTAGYDLKANAFRDAGGEYAVTAIMTGSSGVNHLLSGIDGTARIVNGIEYMPESSFNSYICCSNMATTLVEKLEQMSGAMVVLSSIQAQASAMDVAGAVAVTTLNTLVLPAAGMNSASYSDLNSLLLYNGLQ
jgi:hypothetical protein